MNKKFTKLMAAFALLVFMMPTMAGWGQTRTDYEAVITFDCASASANGNSTIYGGPASTSMGPTHIKAFLNNAAGSTVINSNLPICSSVYWAKGSGGSGIPDAVLKIGTASGSGSCTFTIADSFDEISKVSITGYGWKNTTKVAVNGSATQSPSAAATEVTFDYVLSAPTRTISINITTSAFCATEIVLYKEATSSVYTVTYDCNGGTSGCPENVTDIDPEDNEITLAAAPSRTHYTFTGWNDGTTTYAAGADYTVTSNVTMTAQWTINTHNVTVQGNTHGTVTGYTNPVAYGTEVTLVYTHNNGEYYSATYASTDVTITDGTFTMPDNAVTITVTETALPVYTVTLSDGGTLTEDHYGAGVTLPNRTGDGIYSFSGWTTSEIATETTTAPAQILTGTYHPTENITLYPVYTRSEGEGEKWQKITDFASVNEGTYALITTTGLAFTGTINSSGHGTVTTGSFSFDNNEATSAPSGTCELTLTAVTDNDDNVLGYTMYNSDHNYLYASKAGSGGLSWHETEDDYWHITNKFSSNLWSYSKDYSDNYAFLRTYSSSGTYTFRTYSSGGNTLNGATFYFVKKVSLSTTYYISTLSSIAVPSFDPESQNFSTASLTVTITANEGCVINYTIDGTDPETSATATTTDSNSATVTVTGTTTIKALAFDGNDFSAVVSQTYTRVYEVVLSSNGVNAAPFEVATGESTTLAAPANVPLGFSFRGWTATPATPSTLVSNTYTPNANVTLYAVFGKEIYGDFEKVTSEPSNWNGYYLIVFETRSVALDGSLVTMDVSKNTIDVDINNNVIATNETTNASKFAFASITGGYSIRSASGYYIGRTANTNGLDMSATIPYLNILSYSSGPVITASGGPKLLCWSQGGVSPTWKISYYASSQNAIQLYKQEVVSLEGNYIRVFQNETATAAVDLVGPSIIPSGSTLNMGAYALSNSDAANLIIEDGAQLYTEDVVEATIKKNISAYDPSLVGQGVSNGWYFISYPLNCDYAGDAPTEVTNMIANPATNYDLYKLVDNTWANYKQNEGETNIDPSFTLYIGHGYLYANANDVTLEFAGSLNYPEPEISLENGYNLVGNPYAYNAYPSMSYYKMNTDGTGIEATECSTSVAVAPCTGILVNNEDGNTPDITFSRTAPNAKGGINLALAEAMRGATQMDNAIVSFNEGSQLGKFYFGTQNANIYIPQGNKEYAIVSTEAQGEMPVNFKAAENGTYTLTVNPEGVEMNYLHLIDNMTGMDVDLLQTPSYTFSAATRDYESRFRLVFAASNSANADSEADNFAFFSNGSWIINNVGEATLQVVDVNGRILSTETVNGSVGTTINAASGVYMLRLINGENVKVQKIVVR